ncbi:hypothetical protein, partial [Pseudomonas sp. 43(2021)]|uniref:hypothetical protein n=1 Tax=Pseudomonas sp. 43(2021) TaxID=2813560 RepID=UPI001A9F608A
MNPLATVITRRISRVILHKSFLTASHFNRLESLARRLHGQFVPRLYASGVLPLNATTINSLFL